MQLRLYSIGLLLALVLIAQISPTAAQQRTPKSKDYPVSEQFTGRAAAIIITADEKEFRTRLRDAAKQKPNFAGHYILALWGCGAECLMGAAIDAKTGKVYRIPFTICCWGPDVDDKFKPVEFRIDSALIVFSGLRNEKEGDSGPHFYKFEDNHFTAISSDSKK